MPLCGRAAALFICTIIYLCSRCVGIDSHLSAIEDSYLVSSRHFLLYALVLGFCALWVLQSRGQQAGYAIYQINAQDTEAYVTGYVGQPTHLVISNTFVGVTGVPRPVTTINQNAFLGLQSLQSVTIPDSVVYIGNSAFALCRNLKSVTLGRSVQILYEFAFAETAITSVFLPEGIEIIYPWAFENCTNLTEFTVAESNSFFASSNGVLFSKDMRTLVQYPWAKAGSYTVPEGVTEVGRTAFAERPSLTSVTVASTVTNIGGSAFSGAPTLTEVNFLNSPAVIQGSAFASCRGLTNVNFGSSLVSLSNNAFLNCTALKTVVLPSSMTNIGNSAFSGCTSLLGVVLGENVARIGGTAFAGAANMTSFVFKGDRPEMEALWYQGAGKVKFYRLRGKAGYDYPYANSPYPVPIFDPQVGTSGLSQSNQFSFTWSGAENIPMDVQRVSALGGTWTVVSSNITSGQFTDTNASGNTAFYRAVLP